MDVQLMQNLAAEVERYWTLPGEVRRVPTPAAYDAYIQVHMVAAGRCAAELPTVAEYREAYWLGLTERPREEDESATLEDAMAAMRRIGWDNPSRPSQHDYARLYREHYPAVHPSPARYWELTNAR